jgi:serine/threonine-protein kinase
VHNDIKPGNLFLNAEGECLVGDFGLASLIPAGSTVTVPAGATAETAAPEVASGWGTPAATASIQSDVYSLGATAFWLLASRPPHDLSGARDLAAKMAIVSTQVPRRLREFAPHVPAYLANSIERATARAPAARFATATEFAAALGRRPRVDRIWSRTDEHAAAGHVGCWRGEPRSSGSTYVTCLEDGPSASEVTITTRHLTSSNRVSAGCRVAPKRNAAQALRAVMDRLT